MPGPTKEEIAVFYNDYASVSDGAHEQAIEKAGKLFPRIEGDVYTYGTAGFRMAEGKLDWIAFTVGVLAAIRSRTKNSETIGVMVTASHNKAEDNGVKIVDPTGDMLSEEWEWLAEAFSNASNPRELANAYKYIHHEGKSAPPPLKKERMDSTLEANVIFARDTRPSGVRLCKALSAGIEAVGGKAVDCGELTTPQLHYLVKATNTQNTSNPYGEPTEEGYYKKLAAAFKQAMDGLKPVGGVTVDCANGIGAPKFKELLKHLPAAGEKGSIDFRVVNDRVDRADLLNEKCGADHVKTRQAVPAGFDGKPFDRWASFDGDADRIVYYFNEEGSIFRLLDGDRLAILAATYIGDLVQKAGLSEKVKLSVVQTAYANAASTKYIEDVLRLKVECTPTGVKHLHHAAARADIGVYFEANGHGTVLFSREALKRIHNYQPESPAQLEAQKTLVAVTDLINQTVGDAISDLLLAEVVLASKEYTVKQWHAIYADLPNALAKVAVSRREDFATVPGTAERKLESPAGLQEKIDAEVAKYKDGRCFVRPSGTENVVRIYGEAASSYDVENMINAVGELVKRQAQK